MVGIAGEDGYPLPANMSLDLGCDFGSPGSDIIVIGGTGSTTAGPYHNHLLAKPLTRQQRIRYAGRKRSYKGKLSGIKGLR